MSVRLAILGAVIARLILVAIAATGAEAGALFEQANRLYEQGKYADAVKLYEQVRSSGLVSPALLFNLGNAHFRAGQTGRAIAVYREAEQLSPRDPDLRANLQFAREGANARITEPAWRKLLRLFSLNEWVLPVVACWWIWMGLVVAGKLGAGEGTRAWARLSLGILALSSIFFVAAVGERFSQRTGVLIAKEAVVRNGPLDESQSAFNLREGAEVEILDEVAGWLRVTDLAGRSGWLKSDQLQRITRH